MQEYIKGELTVIIRFTIIILFGSKDDEEELAV